MLDVLVIVHCMSENTMLDVLVIVNCISGNAMLDVIAQLCTDVIC